MPFCDLGVYVVACNEENLIKPCVLAVQKVFPQVEVVDLGSTDTTLERLDDVEVAIAQYQGSGEDGRLSGKEYTDLKNMYSKRHQWVFWVDGDEIWPEESLRRLEGNWRANMHRLTAMRVAWRYLVMCEGQLYASDPVHNGPKLFDTEKHFFIGDWPYETLGGPKDNRQPKKHCRRQWCWHGKMLHRSDVRDTIRDEKREDYLTSFKNFHKDVRWVRIDGLPFEGTEELYTDSVPAGFMKGEDV